MPTELSGKKLLNEILNHQVANRGSGTSDAFYRCYTYPSGKMPRWVGKAERMLAAIKRRASQ